MKPKTRQILTQIFCTKVGWLGITLLCAIVFGLLSSVIDWCEIAMYISFIYPVVLLLIMMVYAWIINPIREYKKNKSVK